MRVAVIVNNKNNGNVEFAASLIDYLSKRDIDLFVNGEQNAIFSNRLANIDFHGIDIALVLGGDGTILTVARELAPYGIPLLGINMGRMGFLCQVEKDEVHSAIDKILQSDYILEKRSMLSCDVKRNGVVVAGYKALNDIVISNGKYVRTLNLKLTINNQIINSYFADGIVVATPTGSTGYSFSAGGPIVLPDTDVVLVTPVCSHTFFSRPIIVSAQSEISITFLSNSQVAYLSADGQYQFDLYENDEIVIQVADLQAKMINLNNSSYFDKLHKKLCNYE